LIRRLLASYVLLCAAATVALSAALAWGTGAAVELLRYPPLPLLGIPLAAALGIAFKLGWRWIVLVVATSVLFVFGVLGFSTGREEPGPRSLRLMSWNAKALFAANRPGGFVDIGWEISLYDPDVVVLQDAQFKEAMGGMPPPVREALGQRQTYVSGEYVVASRVPMRDCHDVRMDHARKRHWYVRCTLTVDGADIELVNVHFISPRSGLNAARFEGVEGVDDWAENFSIRMHQAGLLVRDLAGLGKPLIVAGDLNATEQSPVVRQLLALGLRDAYSSAATGFGYTHGHALKPRFSFLRIDHVLLSRELAVRDVRTGNSDASDHRAVIVDLGWRR
jgi:endonuclease/exonuclease/phosphatase family metal-dependent hydrolase